MKRYEKYKEVNLPWLKEVPEHWEKIKIKDLLEKQFSGVWGTDNIKDIKLKCIRITNFNHESLKIKNDNFTYRGYTNQEYQIKKLFVGDILIEKSGGGDKTPVGRVVFNDSYRNTMCANFIQVLRPIKSVNNKFLAYLLHLIYIRNIVWKYIKQSTGIQNLDLNNYLNQYVILPSLKEQSKIANFLDWKISEIDRLIELEKSKIEKLEEYKRSFAEYLVYKNNEKQTHKIMLSQCTHEQKISNKSIQHQNLLSLSYGKIVRKSIDSTSGLLPESFDNYQIVHDGNIILRLTDLQNDQRSLRVGLATETGIITSAYVCLKTEQNIIPEYLYLHLHAFDLKKGFYGMGAGVRQSLNYKEIKKLPINISSLEDQKKIVNKYNEVSSRIELSKKEIQNQITYLEELKQTLISDVVTGKMDVRDIEIPEMYRKEGD